MPEMTMTDDTETLIAEALESYEDPALELEHLLDADLDHRRRPHPSHRTGF